MLCCFCFVYCQVFFLRYRSNIFHRFFYYVFVVADKFHVICVLLVNCIVLCSFSPVLCSNCGHESVLCLLETNHLYYNNYDLVDVLVFLVIKYLRDTM